ETCAGPDVIGSQVNVKETLHLIGRPLRIAAASLLLFHTLGWIAAVSRLTYWLHEETQRLRKCDDETRRKVVYDRCERRSCGTTSVAYCTE
ncbi:uncharacterized protein V6R79_014168, partial [Siganus canaliculatus]